MSQLAMVYNQMATLPVTLSEYKVKYMSIFFLGQRTTFAATLYLMIKS